DYKEDLRAELGADYAAPRRARSTWKYQRYMRDYLRCVQAVDDSAGAILDYLDQHELAETTRGAYTSGQGFFLCVRGWFDTRLMLGESLTMPILVRWPAQIPAGTRVTDIVSNVDFAATL